MFVVVVANTLVWFLCCPFFSRQISRALELPKDIPVAFSGADSIQGGFDGTISCWCIGHMLIPLFSCFELAHNLESLCFVSIWWYFRGMPCDQKSGTKSPHSNCGSCLVNFCPNGLIWTTCEAFGCIA